MYKRLCDIIEKQQEKCKNTPAFYVGEQLKDAARNDSNITELLIHDLQQPAMTIVEAEKQIKAYADGLRKDKKCVCVTPDKADEILRKFYGLPDKPKCETAATNASHDAHNDDYIDINAYLLGDNYA